MAHTLTPGQRQLALAIVSIVLLLVVGCVWYAKNPLGTRPTYSQLTPAKNARASQVSSHGARLLWKADEMLLFEYGERNSTVDDMYEPRLLDYIRTRVSIQSPSIPRRLRNSSPSHRSQIGQSKMVDNLLKGRRNGFFIEAGAGDGEGLSNSLFFELARNWTGLLVEANPDFHREMLRKNRRSIVLHACLGISRRPMSVKMKIAHWLGGITTNESEDRARFGHWYSAVAKSPIERITCFPLNSVLAALGVTHVDYMSLDVEGVELEILKTIDFSRLRIDVLTIEYNVDGTKLRNIRKFFASTGLYREVGTMGSQDVVFAHKQLHSGTVTPVG